MAIEAKIFRDNDIRGVYPRDLDEGVMYKIGQALREVFAVKKVAIGHDMRASSPTLVRALSDGLLSQGVDVLQLSMISTPMAYFAAATLSVDLAMIVSSSHNPKEYNGLILAKRGGLPTSEEELSKLLEEALAPTERVAKEKGKEEQYNLLDRWLEHVLSMIDIKKIKPLKVVFDAGNSVEAVELSPVLRRLTKIKAEKLYFVPDGSFPNHIPNPLLPEAMVEVRKKVVAMGADVGFAYDGDGDRVIMVDEKGEIVDGSTMTAFLAKEILARHREESPAMLYTGVMSRMVPETIKKYGGRAIKVHVGHSFIKKKMREENALFGGEHSGHFYFRENYYNDSALIGTLKLLEAISLGEGPVSKQVAEFRRYGKHEEISIEVEDREQFIAMMEESLSHKAKVDRPVRITARDGVTFDFEDWWFNLRPSGTEPVVRLNIETYKKRALEEKTKAILKIAQQTGQVKNVVHTHA